MRIILVAFIATTIAGCATTSGPEFELAPDVPETRAAHRTQIAELLKRYDHFQHYIFTQPKELIVKEVTFGKLGGLFGPINKEKANYCIFIKLENPESDSVFSQTVRTYRAAILQQVDNPKITRASVQTIQNKPTQICVVTEGIPLVELSGYVFKRK